jgi:hypothetical protein
MGTKHKFKDVFKKPFIADYEYEKYLSGWGEHTCLGNPIIESASTNTIPYELFEIIQRKFNAERVHLG